MAIKIVSRQKAKALRIPVVMDTSDRGLIDVERFDLEPERPIMHGLVEHLDLSKAAEARTNEEKLPFVIPIIGLDTMSKRMKASMLEIESTVTTWPQLASSVALGGALVADVHRRIALGTFTDSGRWFVDPEELIGAKTYEGIDTSTLSSHLEIPPELQVEDMRAAVQQLPNSHTGIQPLSEDTALRLAEAASLAPSGGNSQPWRFFATQDTFVIFLDPKHAYSTVDPGQLYARLGSEQALRTCD